ncbi:MAG: DUF5320 family protein [Bacilli bacterium]|nr:DUF5320 family protein [Bacilli bacterium]
MPGGDRTGPQGTGAGTGRGRNGCVFREDSNRPIYGRRNGRGSGNGYRNRYYQNNLTESDLTEEKQVSETEQKPLAK